MTENEIAKIIVDAATLVHRTLGGPGLLEAVYHEALAFELESRGLTAERQKAVPIMYKGNRLASDLRLDLLASERAIIECKATVACNKVFEAQALTSYLRLSDPRLALIINFGEQKVRQGIVRRRRHSYGRCAGRTSKTWRARKKHTSNSRKKLTCPKMMGTESTLAQANANRTGAKPATTADTSTARASAIARLPLSCTAVFC